MPTTAGCEAYRYQPEESAEVVKLLIEAGANAEGTSSDGEKSGAKAMPARRAAPSMSRKASQAEFKSMKIAKDRAKERTVVAKEEMVLAKIEGKYKPKNRSGKANGTAVVLNIFITSSSS